MTKKLLPILFLVIITGVFFWQFLFKGLLPIPADTIIGLYHPYRDLYAKDYPNGIPFKNFLITDPVRQQIPWRKFSIDSFKSAEIPSWNPYSFSGTPNIANLQSASFYPLNVFFLFLPFEYSWSFLILLQPLLAGLFMYFYLKNLKLSDLASIFGSVVFAFSGFFVTWLEWGTILHTALWLPLILLSVDKLTFLKENHKFSIIPSSPRLQGAGNFQFSKNLIWSLILIASLTSSFFAGHLQTFFYLGILSFAYFFFRWFENGKQIRILTLFTIYCLLFTVLTAIQWIPFLQFLNLSSRISDQNYLNSVGWFIPWQHLVQFLVPDFFGNPSTLNYWGTWNWGELTGYIGIIPLIFALLALIFKRSKETLFFVSAVVISLIFVLLNPISKLPYQLNLPFISTSQPTRLLFLIDFSLAVLSAIGFNYFSTKTLILRRIRVFYPILILGFLFVFLFIFVQTGQRLGLNTENLTVARRNLFFPFGIFISGAVLLLLSAKLKPKFQNYLLLLLIAITVIDLFRFSAKFNTFSKKEYLFPQTKTISFLQKNLGNYRFATADPRIFPPNFSVIYKIQSAEGYDPLFLNRYAEFIAAINRGEPNIKPPYGFNRIIRLEDFNSNPVDLLGIKYVLSLSEINNPRFHKVFDEGQTKVYENKEVFPKAFFVNRIEASKDKQETISKMLEEKFDPKITAIVEANMNNKSFGVGIAEIDSYSENKIIIKTNNEKGGFLVLTDSFYPTWHAKIDGISTKIYRTDYIFRGIIVPKGSHEVVFYNTIL